VIGVAEDDLRAELGELPVRHRLHRAARADRHEDRRLNHAVRRAQLAPARQTFAVVTLKSNRANSQPPTANFQTAPLEPAGPNAPRVSPTDATFTPKGTSISPWELAVGGWELTCIL
jgi:hypothetical protein